MEEEEEFPPMPSPKTPPLLTVQEVTRNTAGTYVFFGIVHLLTLLAVVVVSFTSPSLFRMKFVFLSHLWTTNSGLALPVATGFDSITESGYLSIVVALCVVYSGLNVWEFGSRTNALVNRHATEREIFSWGAYWGEPGKGHVQHSLVFVGCAVQLLTLLSMQNAVENSFYWCLFSVLIGCGSMFTVGYAYSCLHAHRSDKMSSRTLVVNSWATVLLGLALYVGFTLFNVIEGATFVDVMTNYSETNVAVALGGVVCFLQFCFAMYIVIEIGSSPQQHVAEAIRQVYLLVMIGFYCIVVYLRSL